MDEKQHRQALVTLKEACKEDLKKSKTQEGVDLICNDYSIRCQKHLMALNMEVDWLYKAIAPTIKNHKSVVPSHGPLSQNIDQEVAHA